MTAADITIPVVIGALGTILTAIITRANWSASAKRWTAICLVVFLTVLVGVFTIHPDAWQIIAAWIAFAVSALQVVYSALKPTGVLDWLRDATSPKPDDDPTGKLTD